eukprot:106073-Prorocentrum_lima.AAC.1
MQIALACQMMSWMHEQNRAVVIYCLDRYWHDHHLVHQLCAGGGIHLKTVLSCNLGLKHHQNDRPIKLKKGILTTAALPRLDR